LAGAFVWPACFGILIGRAGFLHRKWKTRIHYAQNLIYVEAPGWTRSQII